MSNNPSTPSPNQSPTLNTTLLTNNDLQMLEDTAKQYKLPPGLMTQICRVESGGYEDPRSYDGDTLNAGKSDGMMQITPETWKSVMGNTPYSADPKLQATAACKLMKKNLSTADGDKNKAISMYNTGPSGKYNADYVKAVLNKSGDPNAIITRWKYKGGSPAGKSNSGPVGDQSLAEATPADYARVVAPDIDINKLEALNNRDLIIKDNLDNPAWFDKLDYLSVGNPGLRKIGTPITFTINTNEFDTSSALSNKKGPIVIELNCSLSKMTTSMKHIINKTNTRTGFHLTFWGMDPDIISGSGSTGAFLNYFGLTNLMSLLHVPSELKSTIQKAFKYTLSKREPFHRAKDITQTIDAPDWAMQVAAQDAFAELLALFRNNGLIRYNNPLYDNESNMDLQRDTLDSSYYSTRYGDDSYTRDARHNDIMIKGNVDFHYKNTLYQGYFKSLQWMIDSENPYQWTFDFTFQVQKTFSNIYYPEESK